MEPFKNLISQTLVKKLAMHILEHDKNFDSLLFQKNIKKQIEALELKDRVRLIANELHNTFKGTYTQNLDIINKVLPSFKGFELWPVSQYIEDFGINAKTSKEIQYSLKTLSSITKLFTAEFAIRNYINHFEEVTYKTLENWAKDSNEHLRRLASEGTRPNLPWGKKLENQVSLMNRNLSILELLKFDESEYVRKSVSNHLNDISRKDKKLYLSTVSRWQKEGVDKKLIRHSLRSLLKAGDAQALKILGYKKEALITGKILKINPSKIREGERIIISFCVHNTTNKTQPILIDFVLSLLQKNSKYSKKVFRIKDFKIAANETAHFEKDYHFKKVTTRKHYPGKQFIKLQINGNIIDELQFELI